MYQNQYRLIAKPIQLLSQADRWRAVGKLKGLSDKAKLRLEWIIFYHSVGQKNVTKTARHFGIRREKLHYWISRFDELNLSLLEDGSCVPHTCRAWNPDPLALEQMILLRKEFIHWGKKKLAKVYKRRYKQKVSSWQFQRVITSFKLYPPKKKRDGREKNGAKKQRINKLIRETSENLFQIDTIVLHDFNTKRYILTAVSHTDKLAYARVYSTHSSSAAKDFLQRLYYLVEGRINFILTDNGSEFQKYFDQTCNDKKIGRYFSRVKTPTDNPEVERFNRTLQEEWLNDGNWYRNIQTFNEHLTDWLVIYNDVRPHETLNLLTPLEYRELCERSSSCTRT